MAATNINRVVLTGNLTADPELRSLPSGNSVCKLRVACNTRRKNQARGEWEDKPNYFNVTVWGAQGENAARYLSKGRPVASRRAPGVARVGDAGGRETPGNRYHCRLGAVPRLARRTLRRRRLRRTTALPAAARLPSTKGTSSPHRSPAAPATTTFRSRKEVFLFTTSNHVRARAPSRRWALMAKARGRGKPVAGGTRRAAPAAAGASPASTAATRSTRSTTRTSRRCASSSPRRARSARAGSRARAVATRSRSRGRSSAPASWRCCPTSTRAAARTAAAAADRERER